MCFQTIFFLFFRVFGLFFSNFRQLTFLRTYFLLLQTVYTLRITILEIIPSFRNILHNTAIIKWIIFNRLNICHVRVTLKYKVSSSIKKTRFAEFFKCPFLKHIKPIQCDFFRNFNCVSHTTLLGILNGFFFQRLKCPNYCQEIDRLRCSNTHIKDDSCEPT